MLPMLIKEMERIPLDLDHVLLFQVSKVQKRNRDRPCGKFRVPESILMTASSKNLPGNDLKYCCTEKVSSCNLMGLQPISLHSMYI